VSLSLWSLAKIFTKLPPAVLDFAYAALALAKTQVREFSAEALADIAFAVHSMKLSGEDGQAFVTSVAIFGEDHLHLFSPQGVTSLCNAVTLLDGHLKQLFLEKVAVHAEAIGHAGTSSPKLLDFAEDITLRSAACSVEIPTQTLLSIGFAVAKIGVKPQSAGKLAAAAGTALRQRGRLMLFGIDRRQWMKLRSYARTG
ncbi:unnamed protein product, partial [Effrenium voratum]